MLPDVYFGKVGAKLPDWREYSDDSADDDEELKETPKSIILILGFDPLEYQDPDEAGEDGGDGQ